MNGVTVVKFGSDLVANHDGVDLESVKKHVSRLVGVERLIVVTSGAVMTGKALFRSTGGNAALTSDSDLKFFAGLGCTEVFNAFEELFRENGRLAASFPITHGDLDASDSFLAALKLNLERHVVTILNEADAFSQTELIQLKTGGDNDGLAALVAKSIDADKLILVTQQGGVMNNDGAIIEMVDEGNISVVQSAVRSRGNGSNGRGGIASKVEAAWGAAQVGIVSEITDENYQRTTKFMVG